MVVESILTSRPFRALFLFLIFVSITERAKPATLDYCASGCTYADPNSAIAVASAGDTILQVGSAPYTIATSPFLITKAITWTSDQAKGGIFVDSAGQRAVDMTSAVTGPTSILNMTIDQEHATSGPSAFDWNGVGVGASLFINNCNFLSTANSAILRIQPLLITSNQFYMKNCKINDPVNTASASAIGIDFKANGIVAGVARIENCLFVRARKAGVEARGVSIEVSALSTGDLVNFYNCTFSGYNTAINSTARLGATNCLFLYNTTDLTMSGPATNMVDWTYNGFAQAVTNGTEGVSNIFGLTSSNEEPGRTNFNLFSTAKSHASGVSVSGITGVSIGLNGVEHGWNGQVDMGCNPYSPALVPYDQKKVLR